MYTSFGKTDDKTLKKIESQHEAAAITMAKQAVSQFVNTHPETTQFPEIKAIKSHDKANIELGETADFRSEINEMSED